MSIGCFFEYAFDKYEGYDNHDQSPTEDHCKKLFEQIGAHYRKNWGNACVVYVTGTNNKNDKCFQNLEYKKKYLYK
jgi:hypothetical protein